ncbi:unnamed protein product [Prunus armeniaca]|uniref:Uncharacterized protein n=1 Tax=Prunus armeniaca TaxID=36596 RepID=A0A6J5TF96_PRUAR|nr:hypothetical protein GBA52_004535 [Prunus armeniaca]CAB4262580.1 unnamed protein product [Prunus armeniaca]CAB4293155.1 unnamed protein product [Prunus armeniaca]
MSTGQLFLKPNLENQNSRFSRPPGNAPQPAAASKSNNGRSGSKAKSGSKKKKGKPSGDNFRISGNTINGGKADKAGVFGFGNKYIGRKNQVEEESSSGSESDDSSEDRE